jgi:hypothetical protein
VILLSGPKSSQNMKHQSNHLGLRRLLLFLVIALFTLPNISSATHFRYGNLTWSRVPGSNNQIRFKMSVVLRHSFFNTNVAYPFSVGTRFSLTSFNTGVGGNIVAVATVTAIDYAEDIFQAEWTQVVTYANPGNYIAKTPVFCCRITSPSLVNNPGNLATLSHIYPTLVQVGPGFNNGNDAPVSTIPPVINFQQFKNVVTYQFPAIDPNGDALTYSMSPDGSFGAPVANNPAGMTISPTGLITWSTDTIPQGKYYYASIRVTDAKGAYSTTDFLIKIVGNSTPPVFDSTTIPPGTVVEVQPGDSIVLKFKSTDPDPGDSIKVTASGVPLGATFDTSKTFTWVPADSQQGTYVIVVTATDTTGVQTSTSFSLDVSYKPRFDIPYMPGNNSLFIIKPGDTFTHPVKAYHPTATDGVILTHTPTPSGMTFTPSFPVAVANPVQTQLQWIPLQSQWGYYKVVYQAQDTFYKEKVYDTVHYIVDNPPKITSTPIIYGYVGQLYNYLLTATDLDIPYGDKVKVEEITKPNFLSVTDNNNATFNIAGIPTNTDIGTHPIAIEVSDTFNHYGGSHVSYDMQYYNLIILPELLVTGIPSHVPINGQSTGAVNITPAGGKGPYTFLWSNGATTEDITGVPAGSYTVTVTDSLGKTVTSTFVVNQPDPLAIPGTVTHVTINGQSTGGVNTTPAGGVGPYTFSWSNSATTEDLTGVPAGSYTVVVTDANGATATNTFVVNQPAPLTIPGTITHVTINGQSTGGVNTTPAGGVGPYTFSWSNSAITEDLTGVPAGTYTVVVTDANGATKSATFIVNQPAPLTVPGVVTNVTTAGGSNGAIDITPAGGVGPYTYVWSNGATTQDLTGIAAGTYTVTVTDANGATKSATFVVTQPANTGFPIVSTCTTPYVVTLESVTLVNGKYEWIWSVRNSNPGNGYNGTVQDLSHWNITIGNCATFSSIVSGATSTNGTSWTSFTPSFQPDPSIKNTCPTGNVIKFNLGTTGSAKSYYKLVTTQNLPVDMQAVAYYKSGTKTGCGTVCFPGFGCQYSVSATHTNVSCNGGNNGSINLTVTGGKSPYTYNWSNGKTTQDISGLTAGTYIVTVTDANGAIKKDTTVITAPSAISIAGTVTNVTCKGSETGKVDITVTGGTAPYTYTWDDDNHNSNSWGNWCGGHNSNTSNNATTKDIDELEAGTYKVTVKDANGCTKTATFTVTEPSSALAVTGSVTNKSCGNTCNGAINITATGGTAPYTYKWNNNSTTEDRTGLCTGTYSVVVTDAKGCTKSASFTVSQATSNMSVGITVNPNPTVSGQAQNTIFLGYGPQAVTLSASASNGGGSYSYSWYPTSGLSNCNAANPVASPTSNKTYTVTVTDANGCTKSSNVSIDVVDVRDGSKILVCRNGDTKKINASQVPSYLNNGYKLGECEDNGCGNKGMTEQLATVVELKLYPNPSTGMFFVELPENVKGGEAVVMDMNGKLIERKSFLPDSKLSFDLSYAPKGTYMVLVSNGQKLYKARVTIQ